MYSREGSTIDLWKKIENSSSEEYVEYFDREKDFLRNIFSKEKRFLDLGCGDGRTLVFVSGYFKKVYGIDYDEIAVNDCRENLSGFENVEIFLEDAMNMHFENNSLDVVFVGLTFSNFGESKFKILAEIRRVLKKDGIFIFSCYNENSLRCRMKLYEKFIPNRVNIVNKKDGKVILDNNAVSEQFSEEKIREILNKENFDIDDIQKGKIFYLIKSRMVGK